MDKQFIIMNLEAERKLLDKLKSKYGVFNKKVQSKKEQIKYLKGKLNEKNIKIE